MAHTRTRKPRHSSQRAKGSSGWSKRQKKRKTTEAEPAVQPVHHESLTPREIAALTHDEAIRLPHHMWMIWCAMLDGAPACWIKQMIFAFTKGERVHYPMRYPPVAMPHPRYGLLGNTERFKEAGKP